MLKKFSDTSQGGHACLSHIAKFVSGLGYPSGKYFCLSDYLQIECCGWLTDDCNLLRIWIDLLAKIFSNIYDLGSVNEATFKAWIDERKRTSPEIINSLSHFKDRIEKADVESD